MGNIGLWMYGSVLWGTGMSMGQGLAVHNELQSETFMQMRRACVECSAYVFKLQKT